MSGANRRLGEWGERQARLHLAAKGYTVVANNFRCRAGEIDIVVCQGDELVFVEVKTRRGDAFGQAVESVSPARAERLAAVAEEFMQSHLSGDYHSGTQWRIDLVCLNLDRSGKLISICHIPNAVEL
jgi:putative endonuclease